MRASLVVELPDGNLFVFNGEVYRCEQIRDIQEAPPVDSYKRYEPTGKRSIVLEYAEGEATFQFVERLRPQEAQIG